MNDGTEFVDLGTDDPSVIGLRVTGKATADTITQLVERLESVQASGHKARLYLDLASYEGYELPVVKEKLAHMGTFGESHEARHVREQTQLLYRSYERHQITAI